MNFKSSIQEDKPRETQPLDLWKLYQQYIYISLVICFFYLFYFQYKCSTTFFLFVRELMNTRILISPFWGFLSYSKHNTRICVLCIYLDMPLYLLLLLRKPSAVFVLQFHNLLYNSWFILIYFELTF